MKMMFKISWLAAFCCIFAALPHSVLAQAGGICPDDHDHELEDIFIPGHMAAPAGVAADLPLTGERTIKIHTNEGTWLSLDVNPNGKDIVFALLGDLYILPISGGKAKQITSGMGFDSQPRYSPDGKSILYISDANGAENAWIYSLDSAKSKVITKSRDEYYQSADWSPDGQYIVVAKGVGTPKLNLLHKDGGSGSLLTPTPADFKAIEPAFGNKNKLVWFSRRKGMWDYNAQLPQYQLATLDMETGEITAKTSRYGSAFSPTLSPDGKWLVYGTRYNTETALVLQNLTTGEEKWLAYPVQHDEQESVAPMGILPAMSFTPDNKNLIVSYGGKIHSVAIDGSGAKEIPFEVDTEIKIGPKLSFKFPIKDDAYFEASQVRDLAVSPDGKKAVFSVTDRLYLMDFPGGKPVRLTEFNQYEGQAAWSPDGKFIAFVTWNGKKGDLYKIAIAPKSKPVILSEKEGIYQEPFWSPDGSKIMVTYGLAAGNMPGTSNRLQARESLNWIPANGGKLNYIAKPIGRNPHFSIDSNRLFYFEGKEGLVSIGMDAKGLDKRSHLKLTAHTTYTFSNTNGGQFSYFRIPASSSSIQKSPVGDKALVQISNELYIVTIPPAGTETPSFSLTDVNSAAFPAWKINEIGAEYPSWSADGKTIYWTLGRSVFAYDVAKMGTKDYTATETKVSVQLKSNIPQGDLLLKGARLITMSKQEVIEQGDILIKNNRIIAVGATGSLKVPAGVKVLDMAGKTITPGFFDLHSHMSGGRGLNSAQSASYAANLAYGVTTTRNPQTSSDYLTHSDMVNSGMMTGPRVYATGPGVAYWAYNIKDLDHARRILRQYSEYYNTKTIKMYAVGNRQQRQWIIMAAKEQGLLPTTEGNLDMKLNFTEVLDGYPGHEHGYPLFPMYKDAIEFIAKSRIAFSSAFLVGYGGPHAENYFYENDDVVNDKKLAYFTPKDEFDRKVRRRNSWFAPEEYVFERQSKIVSAIQKAGGLPTVGAHGQLQGLGYHWELRTMQAGGMSTLETLKAATISGAEAIGLDGDLGSIEAGKLADLVIMNKNPLEDIKNTNTIEFVMLNGWLYDGATLATIAPVKGATPSFDWQIAPPDNLPGVKN